MATHISRHLYSKGCLISCIYSKTEESAKTLAKKVNSPWTTNPQKVPLSADFYFLCVPDRLIHENVKKFKDRKGIWLHTAGAVSIEVFEDLQSHYGVFYPLQTFSKGRPVPLEETPFLIEGSSFETVQLIKELATLISQNVHEMNSASRQMTHLAAVFANNFTNHMVYLAQQILMEKDIDPKLIHPIIRETFFKTMEMGAKDAQTGPALRGDKETMKLHLELLKKYPEWKKLYTFISRDIDKSHKI